jgi:hypothetical protein
MHLLSSARRSLLPLLLLPFLLLPAFLLVGVTPALAGGAPGWLIKTVPEPANFQKIDSEKCQPRGGERIPCDEYVIVATNVGGEATDGSAIHLTDRLPHGIMLARLANTEDSLRGRPECTEEPGATLITCVDENSIPPGGFIRVVLEVRDTEILGSAEAEVVNSAEVQGGGAPPAATHFSNLVNATEPAKFGVQYLGAGIFDSDGSLEMQAGGHPASVTTSINYNTLLNPKVIRASTGHPAVQEPKDEIVDLPTGFIGDALVAPQCPEADLVNVNNDPEKCPAGSAIGAVTIEEGDIRAVSEPIYNVVPEPGYPALFGFEFNEADVYLRPRLLPSGSGYVLSTSVEGVARALPVKISGATITFYGNPEEHDGLPSGEAFLTNPSMCEQGPVNTQLEMDSWVDPERWVSAETPMYEGGLSGCSELQFEPKIAVTPEESQADTPSGYEVALRVPQARDVPGGLPATPDLKNAVVTLPAGVSVSPGAANGLVACPEKGPEGIDLGNHDELDADRIASEQHPVPGQEVQEGEEYDYHDSETGTEYEDELVHPAPGHCPSASKVGTVEVKTPLLKESLHGSVYIAEPKCGNTGQPACTPASAQDGELFGLYMEVAGSGVVVKLKGEVSIDPTTGQITTTFKEAPQLPFSELILKLNNGSRAPLANPQSCGTATTTSDLTPWSTPSTPDATPYSSFTVQGCGNGSPFNPSFLAQVTNAAAGSYSPFTTTFSRHDGEQDLSGVEIALPPGLIGKIAGIAQCGGAEVAAAEANTGGCPEASKVGTATAAAGAGATPFWQSGNVYLTGPYNGAPFGLAVVVPANAGPYHLGNIVVRARIQINPYTAQVTTVSNPLPQMIDGVPLRIQTVNVSIDHEGFILNPTSCGGQHVTGRLTSTQGAQAAVSTPFAVENCKNLPFKPVFTASTNGKTSKANGASLSVKITKQATGEANIAKVDLTIPNQLPSRLTTLQKACTEAQFNANPAGCPAASDIATATVHTPLLNVPLTGPVFFVSHGGAAFPDVEMVLQGEGVKLVVDGHTQIKNGVTYSRFETVPDAPFTSFEFKAPQGPYSIFSANGNLCAPTKSERVKTKVTVRSKGRSRKVTRTVTEQVSTTLQMPTTIVGQNGAVITQNTQIAAAGCTRAKPAIRLKKKSKHKTAKASRGGK